MPTREKMALLYDLIEKGTPLRVDLIRTDVWRAQGWLADPKLSPHSDPVAISRALAGDVDAYDGLTYYEADIVLEGLAAEIDWEFTHSHRALGSKAADVVLGRFGPSAERVHEDVKKWRARTTRSARVRAN